MSFPNVPTLYQKIGKGAEGGHEFARFIRLLLIADHKSKGKKFISESDASGDYKKVDAYSPDDGLIKALNTSYQFKFFPSKLSSGHRKEIITSIQKALKENKCIATFIIITPEDFMKEDQQWFDNLKTKYEKKYWLEGDFGAIGYTFSLNHWGHSMIVELSLKHDHIGILHFPELFPIGIGKFKLSEALIDCKKSNWLAFENKKFAYHQSYPYSRNELVTDPVFDFHFTNSSPEIFLLRLIEIHIISVTTKLKGPPVKYFLKSIGTIKYRMNFKERINKIEFDDPMIFKAGEPMRFKLQLSKFTIDCPGNCATIKLWFHFNNCSIPTESFYLSF
jgi:hypothetical protein